MDKITAGTLKVASYELRVARNSRRDFRTKSQEPKNEKAELEFESWEVSGKL